MKLSPSHLIPRISGFVVSLSLSACTHLAPIGQTPDLTTASPSDIAQPNDRSNGTVSIATDREPLGETRIRQAADQQSATIPQSLAVQQIARAAHVSARSGPQVGIQLGIATPQVPRSGAPLRVNTASQIETTPLPRSPRLVLAQAGFPSTESEGSGGPIFDPKYADEYLIDGGDRNAPVHYGAFTREGLDTEDTVAEYLDADGKEYVRVTNQVAVYSPRFGAVRTVSQTEGQFGILKGNVARDLGRTGRVNNRLVAMQKIERRSVHDIGVRSRGSGLERRTRVRGFSRIDLDASVDLVQNVFQDVALIRRGEFDQSSEAQLAKWFKAAQRWTSTKHPVITASTSGSQEAQNLTKSENAIVVEEPDKKPGNLRIFKLADKVTAKPGDVITFTIRYENVGEEELFHVRIVDNLTPRLQYVDNSAQSDRPAGITVEDNGEGSLLMKFELDEPLPGETAGVIRFQCKVR